MHTWLHVGPGQGELFVPGMGPLGDTLLLLQSVSPTRPRYYHTLFTHSLPESLRTLADESPACLDILMNFLVAAVTKLPPIKVPHARWHQEAELSVSELGGPAALGVLEPEYFLLGGGAGQKFARTEKPIKTFLPRSLRHRGAQGLDQSHSLQPGTASTRWLHGLATCPWYHLACG